MNTTFVIDTDNNITAFAALEDALNYRVGSTELEPKYTVAPSMRIFASAAVLWLSLMATFAIWRVCLSEPAFRRRAGSLLRWTACGFGVRDLSGHGRSAAGSKSAPRSRLVHGSDVNCLRRTRAG